MASIVPKILSDFWRLRWSILGTATAADPTKAMPVSTSNPLPVPLIGANTMTSTGTITAAGHTVGESGVLLRWVFASSCVCSPAFTSVERQKPFNSLDF
ncbi:hypothetical protein ACFFLM_00770 [Deinococcus oregonensis]|uniref:Secreted protein n=1 Tax=Deinococcus oregonensis TaxID=1805970 RepID=A0ABV6ASX0_9DEIO